MRITHAHISNSLVVNRLRFGYGRRLCGFFGRWIRRQRPFRAAVGDGKDDNGGRFLSVLEISAVDMPERAVRAAITMEMRANK
jgi:hypothetical protein